jgi:uncharacterized protein YjbJ (UPF0337 family)
MRSQPKGNPSRCEDAKQRESDVRELSHQEESITMDKDRIAGAGNQAKGAVKEAAGKATGDVNLETSGKIDKLHGKVQSAVGGAKDAVRDAAKNANK